MSHLLVQYLSNAPYDVQAGTFQMLLQALLKGLQR